jgi:hypothetical protein
MLGAQAVEEMTAGLSLQEFHDHHRFPGRQRVLRVIPRAGDLPRRPPSLAAPLRTFVSGHTHMAEIRGAIPARDEGLGEDSLDFIDLYVFLPTDGLI